MTHAPHEQRVVTERTELDQRREKLDAFMRTTLFQELHPDERERLKRQAGAMGEYSAILKERIDAFGKS